MLATAGATGQGPAGCTLLASSDGGLRWTTPVTGTAQLSSGAPTAAFLGFQDARTGRWISGPHGIWITHDGGQHWRGQVFP